MIYLVGIIIVLFIGLVFSLKLYFKKKQQLRIVKSTLEQVKKNNTRTEKTLTEIDEIHKKGEESAKKINDASNNDIDDILNNL